MTKTVTQVQLSYHTKYGAEVRFTGDVLFDGKHPKRDNTKRYVIAATKIREVGPPLAFDITMNIEPKKDDAGDTLLHVDLDIRLTKEARRTHSDPNVFLEGIVETSYYTSKSKSWLHIPEATNTTRGKIKQSDVKLALIYSKPLSQEEFNKLKNRRVWRTAGPDPLELLRQDIDNPRALIPGKYTDPKYTKEPGRKADASDLARRGYKQ